MAGRKAPARAAAYAPDGPDPAALRKEIAAEQQAALEMGIELPMRAPVPIMPPPQLPRNFKEQSPFMAPDANAR